MPFHSHCKPLSDNAQLRKHQHIALDAIDDALFAVDPPGPETCEGMAQRFGFADTGEGITPDRTDEIVDAAKRAASCVCQWQ